MVVALAAKINVRVVLIGERRGSGNEIVVGGRQRVAQLERSHGIGLVRVVASSANNGDVRVATRQRLVVQQTEPDRARVTTAATVGQAGRI